MKPRFVFSFLVVILIGFGLPSSVSAYEYEVPTGQNTGPYFELGFAGSSPSDINAVFTSDVGAGRTDWDTSGGLGASVQLGWDFGKGRADIKLDAFDGGLDDIGGQTASKDDFWYGSLTANGYWDIHDFKAAKYLVITPYVGAGLGVIGGHMRGNALKDGALRNDNRSDVGLALRLMVGAALQFHRHAALTIGYDFLAGDVGQQTPTFFHNQSVLVGLRVTF